MIKTVKSETLKKWLENNEACLVDVREPSEYESEAIKEATLIPLAEFDKTKLPAGAKTGKKLVIHCRSGKRSLSACEKLSAQDPSCEVYNLEGGILAWNASGFPVEKGLSAQKKHCPMSCFCPKQMAQKICSLPIERQIQFVVGGFVLLGSLLAFASPKFLLIPIFFGAGLIYASINGCCGMTKLLMKMPWNKK